MARANLGAEWEAHLKARGMLKDEQPAPSATPATNVHTGSYRGVRYTLHTNGGHDAGGNLVLHGGERFGYGWGSVVKGEDRIREELEKVLAAMGAA